MVIILLLSIAVEKHSIVMMIEIELQNIKSLIHVIHQLYIYTIVLIDIGVSLTS